jgi:hypothetical protein
LISVCVNKKSKEELFGALTALAKWILGFIHWLRERIKEKDGYSSYAIYKRCLT